MKLRLTRTLSVSTAELILILAPILLVFTDQDRQSSSFLIISLCLISAISWLIMKIVLRKDRTAVHSLILKNTELIPVFTEYAVLLSLHLFSRSDAEYTSEAAVMIVTGLSLIVLGNLLPKAEPNAIFGIRTRWSMENRENWRRTSRIGGWIFVFCGLACWLIVLFRGPVWMMIVLTLCAGLFSILASWLIYRSQKRNGEWKENPAAVKEYASQSRTGKWLAAGGIAMALMIALPVFVFGKNYQVKIVDGCLSIESALSADVNLPADSIESIRLVREIPAGSRTNGYEAFGYDLGNYRNDLYGRYLRFTSPDTDVIEVKTPDQTIVFSGSDQKQTEDFYQQLIGMTKAKHSD